MIAEISLIAAVVTALGAVFGLRQSYRERLRQFELKYIDRYWAIVDKLSLSALSVSDSTISESDEKAIRSYLYLCEDELDMRKYGYISDDTYSLWREAIDTQFKQPMFDTVWKKVCSEVGHSGQHPFGHVQKLIGDKECEKEGDKEYEPLHMSNFARFVRGLIGVRQLLGLWCSKVRAMNPFQAGKAAAESLAASATTNPQNSETSTVEPVPAGDASPPSHE